MGSVSLPLPLRPSEAAGTRLRAAGVAGPLPDAMRVHDPAGSVSGAPPLAATVTLPKTLATAGSPSEHQDR